MQLCYAHGADIVVYNEHNYYHTFIEFSIINSSTWKLNSCLAPFVGINAKFTTGSDILLQKYMKFRGNTRYWDKNIEYVTRMPTRLVQVFCY